MAPPKRRRQIGARPRCVLFKPAGVPARSLRESVLSVDEFEALRLADYMQLYHQQAAERMGVSRQTFGRILALARRKMVGALVEGNALRITGGAIQMSEMRTFCCVGCGHTWEVPFGTGRPTECPACNGKNFHRIQDETTADSPGRARAGRRGGGRRAGGKGQGRGADRNDS